MNGMTSGKGLGMSRCFYYYSMCVKTFVYNSGTCMNQLEPVLTEVTVIEVGVENTGCAQLIRSKLELVQAEVYLV
jgi:hypothetical protein